jgi:hypothetical protein
MRTKQAQPLKPAGPTRRSRLETIASRTQAPERGRNTRKGPEPPPRTATHYDRLEADAKSPLSNLACSGCPFSRGPEEENGEKRDIVRASDAWRPMSIFLAIYPFMLQATRRNRCPLLDSLGRNLRPGTATIYRDAVHLEVNPGVPELSASDPSPQRPKTA